MKEKPEICKFCKYYKAIPFSLEHICENEDSMYADCECAEDDSCEEFEETGT